MHLTSCEPLFIRSINPSKSGSCSNLSKAALIMSGLFLGKSLSFAKSLADNHSSVFIGNATNPALSANNCFLLLCMHLTSCEPLFILRINPSNSGSCSNSTKAVLIFFGYPLGKSLSFAKSLADNHSSVFSGINSSAMRSSVRRFNSISVALSVIRSKSTNSTLP